jgi:hypothetical protein
MRTFRDITLDVSIPYLDGLPLYDDTSMGHALKSMLESVWICAQSIYGFNGFIIRHNLRHRKLIFIIYYNIIYTCNKIMSYSCLLHYYYLYLLVFLYRLIVLLFAWFKMELKIGSRRQKQRVNKQNGFVLKVFL